MSVMGKLSHAHKLTARTAPAVVDGMDDALLRAQRRGLKFQAGPDARRLKIGMEGLIGAILLHFLDQPEAEQGRVVAAYLPRLEALFTEETPPVASPVIQVNPATGHPVKAKPRKGVG